MPIQPDGSSAPIFLVHEIEGGIACYSALANALGSDQPVYAFRPPSPKHGLSIRELAALYLRDLFLSSQAGPYILGGYSFGGLVAYEMALQLHERGGEPPVVVMFDTWVPGFNRFTLRDRASLFLRNAEKSGTNYLLRKINDKGKYWGRIATRDILNFAGSLWEWFDLDVRERIYMAQAEVANTRALASYKPAPYCGRVLLIMSSDTAKVLRKRGDPTLGWGNLIGASLEICTVKSDHSGILRVPGVREVARLLQGKMDSCLTRPGALKLLPLF